MIGNVLKIVTFTGAVVFQIFMWRQIIHDIKGEK